MIGIAAQEPFLWSRTRAAVRINGMMKLIGGKLPDRQPRTKTLYLNGVVVGEVEATGYPNHDKDAAIQFLKDKGLHKVVTPVQAMFRQAVSFATTAAHLHKTDLLTAPRNGFSVAPFVVNSTFSIELYLKTLSMMHNKVLRGHELLNLFDSLPTEALQKNWAA
jgi:hypothetical protein